MSRTSNAFHRTAQLGGLLTLALTACGKAPQPSTQAAYAPVKLTAPLPALSTQGVQPQGVPQGTTSAELNVFDGGTELLFDANGYPSAAGSRLTFTPAQSTKTVFLPVNKNYDFKIKALDDRTPANTLAYGEKLGVNIPTSGASVNLTLRSIILNASLRTLLGVRAVDPGQIVDVGLSVVPQNRIDLLVPESDYTVTYSVQNGSIVQQNGTNVESKRGVRVQASGEGQLTVTAEVTGLFGPGTGTEATLSTVLGIPVNDVSSGIGVDITPPAITFDVAANPTAGSPVTLSGNISDDVGVQKVEVYDGVAKIGEANLGASTWGMTWTPSAGDHDLQVLAYDAAGNVGRARKFSTTRFTSITRSESGSIADFAAKGEYGVIATGNVKVFKQSGGIWTEQATLGMGTYVDTDGLNVISGDGSGVTIYRQNGTWTNEASFPVGVTEANRIGVSGDYAVVGSPSQNGNKGAVFVYKRSGGTWSEAARLDSAASTAEGFGTAVSINGTRLVVGAPSALNGGVAYVYELNGGAWTLSDTLSPGTSGNFGLFVDVLGNRVLVGSSSATAVFNKSTVWSKTMITMGGRLDQDAFHLSIGGNIYRLFERAWVDVTAYGSMVAFTQDGAMTYRANFPAETSFRR
ncbi:Ig-like domain-containing protein [Deinococcus yavapaiensis]|uniref:FG-GAP repeat protein n=1 Tax=Deinococcus yavapaiensis KR-236 TaxID=694435 RepID=A0A318S6M7_9DEIO|nr:Ig-like domain-containing protein [Deinococcus yavapaiensis]PYE53299.1 FG-GAP repeat protein [Deinococcus yavapaiensis KR-236]